MAGGDVRVSELAAAGREANLNARREAGGVSASPPRELPAAKTDLPDKYVGMNKTEKRRAEELEAMFKAGEIAAWWGGRESGITLQLAFDTRYTPDFLIQENDGRLRLEEVKGYWRDDAKAKTKVCVAKYPFPLRVLVARKGGGWTITPIHPERAA